MAGTGNDGRRRRCGVAPALVALHLSLIPGAALARQSVTFDFGWRWRLGLHAVPAPGAPSDPPNISPGQHPAEVGPGYDDSNWSRVQLPHNGLVAQGANNVSCPTGCSGRSFIPRHAMWYRKTFKLPQSWVSSSTWVEFDGVFHATIVYLNGHIIARNAQGYLGFRVALSGPGALPGVLRGPAETNTIALFVDPDGGAGFSPLQRSGWWYEGAGIYRHARIVRSAPVRVAADGLVARSNIQWAGDEASSASVFITASIENIGKHDAQNVRVNVSIVEKSSAKTVASSSSHVSGRVAHGDAMDAVVNLTVLKPKLWNAREPNLYDVVATVLHSDQSVDQFNITHGFRTLDFTGVDGQPSCSLNRRPFKWRGFCDVRAPPVTFDSLYDCA